MLDSFEAPPFVMKTILIIIAIGFPIWLVFSWVYDLSPQGITKTSSKNQTTSKSPKINQRLNRTIIAFLTVAVSLLVVNQFRPSSENTHPGDKTSEVSIPVTEDLKSIAVLPFANLSDDEEQEYFCSGIAEDILNDLAHIENIRVVARTSSFAFKDKNQDVREIGQKLGVNSIVEGSVRKAGNQLRISVQLIDVSNGYSLWSERYDRDLEDVFAIQTEIAESIVQVLEIKLSNKEQSDIEKVKTQSIQAYDYYIQGRAYYHQNHRTSIKYAIEMFSRAIQIDRDYALAYSGLADSYSLLYMYFDRNEVYLDQALEASQNAIDLDPELAEAHVSRGAALAQIKQYKRAEKEFETAIQLNPKLFSAYYQFARTSRVQGKLEQTLKLFKKATQIRPENYEASVLLASAYEDLHMDDEMTLANRRSVEVFRNHLELHPDDSRALYLGAFALEINDEKEEAIQWIERAISIDPNETALLYNVACFYSRIGMEDLALDYFEKTIESGFSASEWIEIDTDLDPIRNHPRFQEALKQI